jgi:predicted permease
MFRAANLPFQGVAAFSGNYDDISVRLPNGGAPGAGQTDLVSGNFFDVMRVRPLLGRALTQSDDRPGAAPVVVVGEHFWRTRLNASPAVIGQNLIVNRLPVTIVGVVPAPFFGVRVRRPDLWTPLEWQPQIQQRDPVADRARYLWLQLVGRLQPGAARSSAEVAATTALHQSLFEESGSSPTAQTKNQIDRARVAMASAERGVSEFRASDAEVLGLLMVGVGLVLLIACTNVATLLLCRGTARRPELAMRRALGASRGRLVRQWLTESAVLAAIGTLAAMQAAHWVEPLLVSIFPTGPIVVAANGTVFLFAAGLTLFAIFTTGLPAAIQAGRVDPLVAIRTGGRGSRRRAFGASQPFVTVQPALSLMLVLRATLFARTLFNLEHEPLGFEQHNVLLVRINPRATNYTSENVGPLYRRLYDRVSTLPGVESATFARYSPFGGFLNSSDAKIEGYTPAPGENMRLESLEVGPDYPQTLGMPIVGGRAIDLNDAKDSEPVAMVNQVFARRFYPRSTAVGHHVHYLGTDYRIVGVVKDALFHDARDPAVPFLFTPMLQAEGRHALECEIEVRTTHDAATFAAVVRRAIAKVDSRVSVSRSTTLHAQVIATFSSDRLVAAFVATFAGLALLLAAIGVYGVVAHSVAGRTREIGVRIAIGASASDVVWLVLRDTLACVIVALGVGIVAAAACGSLVAHRLFDVTPLDPVSMAISAAALVLIAAAATFVPGAYATRIHPAIALRSE